MKNVLYHHYTAPAIWKYWSEKHYFSTKPIEGIDWTSFESAARRTPCKQHRWLTKHFAHNSATSLVMHRRGERDNTKCPLCETLVENSDHLITCEGNEMEETFIEGLDKLVRWITETSDTPIAAVMKEFLISTREQRDFILDPLWNKDICILVSKQLNYGQRATVHGFLTNNWKLWHADYLKDVAGADGTKSPPPEKWVADLIMHIWELNFNLWCKRCELDHGSEEKRIITLNGENIDEKITTMYNNLPHPRMMNPSERSIFSFPLRKVLALPVKPKLRYYRRKRRIMDNYLIRRGTNRSRDNMMQWLQSGTRCPTATPSDTPTPRDTPSETPTTAQVRRTTPTTQSASATIQAQQTRQIRQQRVKKKTQTYREKDIAEYFSPALHIDEDPPDDSCDTRNNEHD